MADDRPEVSILDTPSAKPKPETGQIPGVETFAGV
jgi:hypothetical protein